MSQPAFTGSQMVQLETIFNANGINLDEMQQSALELTDRESRHNPSSSKS